MFLPLVKSWNYSHFRGSWGHGWPGTADLWSENNLLHLLRHGLCEMEGERDTLRLVMKSHSPQVGPGAAGPPSIWRHPWKGGGLSFSWKSLPSFCFFFSPCWNMAARVSWESSLTSSLHLLTTLAVCWTEGWLRTALWGKVNRAKDDAQVCKPSHGYSGLCVCVCLYVNISVRKLHSVCLGHCVEFVLSVQTVQNKWHTPSSFSPSQKVLLKANLWIIWVVFSPAQK